MAARRDWGPYELDENEFCGQHQRGRPYSARRIARSAERRRKRVDALVIQSKW